MEDNEPQKPETKKSPNNQMIQRVIDPQTGKDITTEYINARLKELEQLADDLIKTAIDEVVKHPTKRKAIYANTYWEIHNRLGMGSIGPATAAAGPLMEIEKLKLAELLDIDQEDRIL
jgi:hypothetical protein